MPTDDRLGLLVSVLFVLFGAFAAFLSGRAYEIWLKSPLHLQGALGVELMKKHPSAGRVAAKLVGMVFLFIGLVGGMAALGLRPREGWSLYDLVEQRSRPCSERTPVSPVAELAFGVAIAAMLALGALLVISPQKYMNWWLGRPRWLRQFAGAWWMRRLPVLTRFVLRLAGLAVLGMAVYALARGLR